MKTLRSTTLICAIAAASMGFSTASFAQRDHDHNRPQLRDGRPGPGGHRGPPVVVHPHNVRPGHHPQMNRPGYRPPVVRPGYYEQRRDAPVYYYNARGPEFRRGGYIPREFRQRQYVVVNHQDHHLAYPPRGHEWVQVGTDYVLIAIATGLIAQIVLSQ